MVISVVSEKYAWRHIFSIILFSLQHIHGAICDIVLLDTRDFIAQYSLIYFVFHSLYFFLSLLLNMLYFSLFDQTYVDQDYVMFRLGVLSLIF